MKKQDTQSAEVQNRCIWMTAGVISHKLCPFNYDCEHCDFDRVMRLQAKPSGLKSRVKRYKSKTILKSEGFLTSKQESEQPFFTFSVGEVDERLYIHPTHLWARREYDHTWKVGVDKLLGYILPPPVKVEFCNLHQDITRDQVFGRILTGAGAVSITAPLSGRLLQTNSKLAKQPELVQQDPWGEGWLAMIDSFQDDSELERLYTGTAGSVFLKEEAQHLKFLLRYRGVEVKPAGRTLPDGGANIQYLYQILPVKVCLRLTREVIALGNII